jgi:uncharacterized repeat protein (TIGR03803 family)
VTQTGGSSGGYGIIFKIKPDGTGYAKLHDFSGGINGSFPVSTLISDGTFLYGMTNRGGTGSCPDGCGIIFKIKPDGTGYSKIFSFSGTSNGSGPVASLIYDGNFLYGVTPDGGTNDQGVIFKIKSDGTAYSKLHDFYYPSGGAPFGSLISDGTFLYGLTHGGGINNRGAMFQIKSDGTSYSKLFDFDSISGRFPMGTLVSDGSLLYGMTSGGGTGTCTPDCGTIFKFHPVGMGVAENNMKTDFSIYPNPSNGTFTIASKEIDFTLHIINLLGENIYQSEIKKEKSEIDLSNCQKGIYFVRITNANNNVLNKKIIIE